ncbi:MULTISPECIES: GNAT family N-acetyltransferase [unclassified Gemella]|uniref:GNAT family N-acetyltransferase n=1 Tax=unclassified Gemella TaxID=2624949 RepID=UPI001C04FA4E|nr:MULTISPECIES: GNAT family N-acetyltransferase [unclassified Gemella]MBU0279389.1 GNAT family N-acetyltransferase [Gemella sp. zg-1178]QWQ39339.1 GNAT family N-acetyltransferase [Gemella sp. zg-570]
MEFREIEYSDIELILKYKNHILKYSDHIHGAAGLKDSDNIENWIKEVKLATKKETLLNKDFVPANTFVLIIENKIVGIINLRHELNDYLFNFGGHIGYSVRHDERRKGYAKLMMKKCLEFSFDNLKLDKILVTCDSENIASEKTILASGGILENIVNEGDKLTKRHWIYKNK